jgi:hypothetical protein
MVEFYVKSGDRYIPITVEEIFTDDWEDKLISIRVGSDAFPALESEIEEIYDCLSETNVIKQLVGSSFLVTLYNLDFEVLGDLKELGDKYITIKVTSGDDLSKIGSLQKQAKKQLRDRAKKTIILPAPLTVKEYAEIIKIKERCDTRRARRSK